ncbi:XrtA system polysaccharide chain length determinant [Sphingomonas solaris]|uniref:Chain-length determining protein n=1 Tax=Alterirhizorhabdus solaris TaxID=2529389 RepID=A0A558R9R7_9SPHN|nr:XrtA system polysaccharide chain length determinant [Sphingomonas solaris]TVV76130.1 chain-length determining protein [Sphingomonas solaris]
MNGIYDEIRIAVHQVWHRRWLALAVMWGICLAGWLVIALIPNSYESGARLFVQMQSILPEKMGISTGERMADIDRVRQTLTSAENLERVVRSTDLVVQAGNAGDVDEMVARLQRNITVKSPQDNMFEIGVRTSGGGLTDAQNARLAKTVTEKLLDLFVAENLAGDRAETGDTIRFLDGELARREKALQVAEQARAAFEQKYVGLLPGVGSIAQRMEAARSESQDVEANLMAAQSALSALNGQLGSTPATVAAPSFGGGSVGGARGRIAALEAQISDDQAKGWTEAHPDVIAARQQINRLRGAAASEGRGGSTVGTTPNPMYMTLRSMQAEKQATVAALTARRAQIGSDMSQFAAKQAAEPGVVAEQSRLNRDYDVLKAQYDKLLSDREDVRLRSDVATKTDSISFRVIDPPYLPRVPVSPNRPLLLALVLVLGIAGGVGAAFAKAQLQTTYATAERLARASGLPVLGAVGEVLTPANIVDRRKRLVWFAGGAGALGACFALLLLVEFVQRGMMA